MYVCFQTQTGKLGQQMIWKTSKQNKLFFFFFFQLDICENGLSSSLLSTLLSVQNDFKVLQQFMSYIACTNVATLFINIFKVFCTWFSLSSPQGAAVLSYKFKLHVGRQEIQLVIHPVLAAMKVSKTEEKSRGT